MSRFLLAVLVVAAASAVAALSMREPAEPLAMVETLYAPYKADPHAEKNSDADEHKTMRAMASTSLAKALDREENCKEKTQEICALDASIVIMGQDWWLKDLVIMQESATPQQQVVRATFLNGKTNNNVRYFFIREDGAWKLDDIHAVDPQQESGVWEYKNSINDYFETGGF